ncbi:T9SS type A sorting domain-containing protein [Hymenobacter fodinae]|uniref:T9SS type A sorting domain-containing protein n=1 Tax=Hymenobacter fodinae TaxID=2510796 RepID=A0A4Z0PAK6_9BACT|nr:T9SS type A sorting domain-containing protein [Hymenobacter fodinae]TGE08497.1 T9SS type A sorting domain-containing protein [Hymenobacter fodinae]
MTDVLGHSVRTATLTVTQQVAVSGLAPGLYTLRASDTQGRQYVSRLMVQ